MPKVGGVFAGGGERDGLGLHGLRAAAMGDFAMTSSSGPGISLKAEGISILAGARLPAVIVNVMRGGPGPAPSRPPSRTISTPRRPWATEASG